MAPTVAMGSEFLDGYGRIPVSQQKKVREFIQKFHENPTSNAINYESLRGHRNPHVRTVRIDQKYRAVVLHPDAGNIYVLLWVDNHDAAMDWALRRTFEVNPRTGSLQVYVSQEARRDQATSTARRAPGLLAAHSDQVLLSFGVPQILLPAVRSVASQEDLLALGKHIPSEAAEALYWLADGETVESVREAIGSQPSSNVDTADLAAALAHPDSRRRFVTIRTDQELTSILEAPLEKWRVFLHPSQEKLVNASFNGPARVTGGAGTGKTVVAMHRARHLAKTRCVNPQDRILFTTYTANLAQIVEGNLAHLCGPEKQRIEVVHLHAWAVRFLMAHGRRLEVAGAEEVDACWSEAITSCAEQEFDAGFFKQEWDQVVQRNDIETEAEYLKVARTGRGKTISRAQRKRAWRVMDQYAQALLRRGKVEWASVIKFARNYIEVEKPTLPYRAVVVDESQDFHAWDWRLIRATVPCGTNDIFLVGDAHQRIYGQKVPLKACGINVQGRASRLRINYRTTEEIRAWAMAMLEGVDVDDLDGEREDDTGYKSVLTGPSPEIHHFKTRPLELEHVGARVRELLKTHPAEHICITARRSKLLREDYGPMLASMGIHATLLDQKKEGGGVRLATMHRIKGLEFPVMILAGINAKYMPLDLDIKSSDPVARAEHEALERSLLFVAATRARDMLIVTGWGAPSPFLRASHG
jgi:hypothetical protein